MTNKDFLYIIAFLFSATCVHAQGLPNPSLGDTTINGAVIKGVGPGAGNVASGVGWVFPVEQYGAISGTDPSKAAANTVAFAAAFAAGRHVTCQDDKTYVVNAIYVPAAATGLSGGCALVAAPTMAEGAGVLDIYGNTGKFTLDGLTIKAVGLIGTTTGTVTASSTTITGVISTTGIALGQVVSGARIPAGSVVTAIGTGTITIDQVPYSTPAGSVTETISFYHKWDAVDIGNENNVTISNTTLSGRDCSDAYNVSGLNVTNNTCTAYVGRGFRYDGAGTNIGVRYTDNTVYGGTNSYFGIYVNAAKNVHIDRNTVRGTDLHPIMLVGGTAPISNFTVNGNVIDGTLNEGLFFAAALNNGTISGNVENLAGSIDNGISIDASGGYAIADLVVSGNEINSPGVTGIFVGEVNSPGSLVVRVIVTGNKIMNPNSYIDDGFEDGIQVFGAGAQVITVAGNDITNFTGRMRYNVGEVAGTDGAPSNNLIGPNTGFPGTLGTVNAIGSGTQVFATPPVANPSFTGASLLGSVKLGGKMLHSATAPVPSGGFCNAPVVNAANGTAAFAVAVGSSCAGSSGTLTLPAASVGWLCHFDDLTAPASNAPAMTGSTPTTVTVSNFSRTTGANNNWPSGEVIAGQCVAF